MRKHRAFDLQGMPGQDIRRFRGQGASELYLQTLTKEGVGVGLAMP